MINGKNNYDCSLTSLPCVSNAGLASFNFTAGKTHRLRLINPGAAGTQKFSIDGHTMTIIANDFVEVQPYETQVVTLGVGQRTDVIVKATGNPGSSYWMRSFIPPNSGRTDANQWNEVQAAIYYNGANTNNTPTSSPVAGYNSFYLGNDPLSETVPVYPMPVGNAATTDTIVIDLGSNGTHLLWYQNNQTFRTDYNDPVTFQAQMGNLSYPPIRSVHNYGSNASVRFIVENHSGFVHPMHLHGHNMFILAEGYCTNQADDSSLTSLAATGTMETNIITAEVTVSPLPTSASDVALTKRATNGTITSMSASASASASASTHSGNATTTSFGIPSQAAYTASPSQVCWDGTITRASNPQRRDVQQLLPGGYIVVQWNQDNPGIWPFHCHIAWHISAGFLWNVLEQPDQIKRGVNIPESWYESCAQWDTYSNREVIDQIDSGQ